VHPVEQQVMEWDEYTGRLEAVESVEVRARVSGLIVATPFLEGTLVHEGDLLVEIDVRPFQAALAARTAEEAQAAAQVELANIEYDRIDRLCPEARTPTELDTAAATLEAARAAREAAAAAVDAAKLDVEWCHVTAPITGRISSRYVTPGNLITGGSGTGTLLTTITSIDPIYCYLDVDERSMLKYQKLARAGERPSVQETRLPADLQLANEQDFPHQGVLDFIDNRVDPGTGTIRARGVFANPDGLLTPGYFARVRVPGSGRYDALLVPDSAVTTNLNERMLYVVDANNTVQPRPVELGALFGELRAIASGIDRDDLVVTNGQFRTRPGMKVTPQEEAVPVASLSPLVDWSAAATTRPTRDVTARANGTGGALYGDVGARAPAAGGGTP